MKRPVSRAWGILALLAIGLAPGGARAADPPELLNYQGVLRDASDVPEDGSFDMVFRFFDSATLGNEILVDEHLASGTGDVVVTTGLFNVKLGGGAVADGFAMRATEPRPGTVLGKALEPLAAGTGTIRVLVSRD